MIFSGRSMRLRSFVGALLMASLSIGLASSLALAFEVPPLTGPVVDSAGLLDVDTSTSLDMALRRIRDAGGPQINVLTVQSLDGLPIETASIQVTDKWKLGGRKEDDGVLLLVAPNERRIRIEVGQGLEGVLTDLHSKQIIEDVMVPFFRAGRPGDGIAAGVRAIVERVAPDKLASLGEGPPVVKMRKHRSSGLPWPVLLIIVIAILIIGGGGGGRRGRTTRDLLTGAALGGLAGRGGGGGWSGGGGGGWSGGGGGFSGGGASGGW